MKKTVLILTLLLPLSLAMADDKDVLVRDLERSLMASCFHGTVAEHGDARMEKEIRELVQKGETKEEITNYYVGIYGERILAAPVARGFNLMAWLAPGIVFVIALLVLVSYLKVRSREPVRSAAAVETTETRYDDVIERELKEMD
ncbi:MAG: cytochrome c-type biogenesis protein CcmH [Fidelibacterota bacterium]